MIDFGLDPDGPKQAGRCCATSREYLVDQRLAGPAGAAGDRRGAEPQRSPALEETADALEPRDREVEAAADRPGRPAGSARQAGGAGARAAAAADHGQLSPASRSTPRRRRTTSTIACAARAIGAPLEFPRDVTDSIHARSRGVPRLINVICDADAGLRLRRGAPPDRRGADRRCARRAGSTGVLCPRTADAQRGRAARLAAARSRRSSPRRGRRAAAASADARHWPPTAARTSWTMARGLAALEQREQAVRQREHELARAAPGARRGVPPARASQRPSRAGRRGRRRTAPPAARRQSARRAHPTSLGAARPCRSSESALRRGYAWRRVKRICSERLSPY